MAPDLRVLDVTAGFVRAERLMMLCTGGQAAEYRQLSVGRGPLGGQINTQPGQLPSEHCLTPARRACIMPLLYEATHSPKYSRGD